MLKKLFLIFFMIFIFIMPINAANLKITSDVYSNYTIFNYQFQFNKNESYSKISIEKPKGSLLESAIFGNHSVKYSTAGSFFIFDFNSFKSENFTLKFKSYSTSKNIFESNSFFTYVNLNIPVENLNFRLNLKSNFGKVLEIFPRNYELKNDFSYSWKLQHIAKDSLFLLKFDKTNSNPTSIITKNDNNDSNNNSQLILYLYFIIPTILLLVVIFLLFRKKDIFNFDKKIIENDLKKEIIKEIKNDTNNNLNNQTKQIDTTINKGDSNLEDKDSTDSNPLKQESFEEILEKYATENEKEILILIKNHNGIAQYDILNYLPTITKSNLSKIISKLHSRRFLNKVRVGKINKIYLGDKFESTTKENSKQE